MPRLSRFYLRSSLICLSIGFAVGGLILMAKAGTVSPRFWGWLAPHIILLLFGWLVQFAVGVAYWILPRVLAADRGRPRWAWSSFAAFQLGLALTAASLLSLVHPGFRRLLALGALIQALAVVLFAVHAWPRIRGAVKRATTASLDPDRLS